MVEENSINYFVWHSVITRSYESVRKATSDLINFHVKGTAAVQFTNTSAPSLNSYSHEMYKQVYAVACECVQKAYV
jgi:hypothetical protein